MGISLVLYLIMTTVTSDAVLIYSVMGGFGTICLLPVLLGTSASVVMFFRRHPGTENAWKALIAPSLAFIGLAAVLTLVMTHLDLMVGNKLIGVICALALLVIIGMGVSPSGSGSSIAAQRCIGASGDRRRSGRLPGDYQCR